MTDSITPPPELVQQWATVNGTHYEDLATLCGHIATQAARWGADQELEACCEWVAVESIAAATELRAARRPKPSLKPWSRSKPTSTQAALATPSAASTGAPQSFAIQRRTTRCQLLAIAAELGGGSQ